MAFTNLYVYFVFVQFVCHVTNIPCQLDELNIKIVTIELLLLPTVNIRWLFLSSPFFL